jgi:hypothetical protein
MLFLRTLCVFFLLAAATGARAGSLKLRGSCPNDCASRLLSSGSCLLFLGRLFLTLALSWTASLSHPAKVPEGGLPFCNSSATRATSCCTAEDASRIKVTVDSLMRDDCPTCKLLVAEWKCAECNPNARDFYVPNRYAHILCCRFF